MLLNFLTQRAFKLLSLLRKRVLDSRFRGNDRKERGDDALFLSYHHNLQSGVRFPQFYFWAKGGNPSDSVLRRRVKRIVSPASFDFSAEKSAVRRPIPTILFLSQRWESDPRPLSYQESVLPLNYFGKALLFCRKLVKFTREPEPPLGFEPRTHTLQKCCSAAELRWQT